ncbi:hypothetical protein [Terriglobus sp. ADX1]|uniref:hypothetical protein n=1 Tax=Terriglobus sp. ADX1 TaxID=2794063 RepID=UPI002FE6049D
MQRFGFRRVFPWRTALLLGSIPALALAMFLVWFRWELPPLQAYYLVTYWESSKSTQQPASTTPIQWLYKAAPGRQSEPLIDQDVDSNGSGLVPIGLSSSARRAGWTQLVEMPVQNWNSSELERFLKEYFYGNRTFREVLSEPLFFLVVIPFIFLFGVILMKREIVEEWRQLYAGPFGDDLIFDMPVLWRHCKEQVNDWKGRLIANTKTSLSSRRSVPKEQAIMSANAKSYRAEAGTPLRYEKQVVPAASPVKPTRRLVFPGAEAIRNGDGPPKPWHESQWID